MGGLEDGAAAGLLAALLSAPGVVADQGRLADRAEEGMLLRLFLAVALPPERRVMLTRQGRSWAGLLRVSDVSLAVVEVPDHRDPAADCWRVLGWSGRPNRPAGAAAGEVKAAMREWLGLERSHRLNPGLVAREREAAALELCFTGWGDALARLGAGRR